MAESTMSLTHVVIIGAGVGGLALAQGLKRRNIPFSVYERDACLNSRHQGYRLKIFGDMKTKLHQLLTSEAWTVFEATCAQSFLGETNLNATDAAITACRRGRLPPGAPLPYTADRGLLRQAMMTGISSSVHFGKEFLRYEIEGSGQGGGVRAVFSDGTSQNGTLLVGADGSRSRVRQQLLPHIPDAVDTGTCCIYGKSPLSEELQRQFPPQHRRWITVIRDTPPTIASIVTGTGPITMVSEACHFSNRDEYPYLPEDYVHWGILFRRDLLGLGDEALSEQLKREAVRLAQDITSEWHPSIRSLVELHDEESVSGMRIFSTAENMRVWEPDAQITVLGDAVHIMSPTGGVGAVAALNDAYELMKAVEAGASKADISRYEKQMREFAGACIRRTNAAGTRMLDLAPNAW